MSFSFPGKDGEMLRMAEKTQPLWGGKERNRKSELGLLLEARKRLELPDGGDVSGNERAESQERRPPHPPLLPQGRTPTWEAQPPPA